MVFQEILRKRNLEHPLFPLWRLKVTDDEYEDLKNILRESYRRYRDFSICTREALLYYAEWWKRDYIAQNGRYKVNVFNSLEIDLGIEHGPEKLYIAAERAFKSFDLQVTCTENNRWPLYSILYQGGLPLKHVVSTVDQGLNNWSRLLKSLITGRKEFDDNSEESLKVARKNDSVKEFCRELVDTFHNYQKDNSIDLFPFALDGFGRSIFSALIGEVSRIENSYHATHPFDIKWEYHIDEIGKKIAVNAVVTGRQSLAESYLNQFGLTEKSTFSICVSEFQYEDSTNNTHGYWDYCNNYCNLRFSTRFLCAEDSIVSVQLAGQNTVLLSKSLSVSSPIILYKNETQGRFYSCEHVKKGSSAILVPDSWEIIDSETTHLPQNHSIQDGYSLFGKDFTLIKLYANDSLNIKFRSLEDGEVMSVSLTAYNSWTSIESNAIEYNDLVEVPLYQSGRISFYKNTEEESTSVDISKIKYRFHGTRLWHELGPIPIGSIDACVQSSDDTYIKPVSFINTGTPLLVHAIDVTANTCKLDLIWDSGIVEVENARKEQDGKWFVQKTDHPLVLHCLPENNGQPFDIKLKTPFREIRLYSDFEKITEIQSQSCIPYCKVSSYSYHINDSFFFKVNDLYVLPNTVSECEPEHVNYFEEHLQEGTLTDLLGGLTKIREKLDFTFGAITQAKIKVELISSTNEGQRLVFYIQDYPYKISELQDRTLSVFSESMPVTKRCYLFLFSLTYPEKDKLMLEYDEDTNTYLIPESAQDYGKVLVCGSREILPKMIDLEADGLLNDDERANLRKQASLDIYKTLETADFNSSTLKSASLWFDRCGDAIPYSSILDVAILSEDSKFLIKFVIYKYWEVCEDKDCLNILLESLLDMQNDLSFSWWWVKIDQVQQIVSQFLQSYPFDLSELVNKYIKVAKDQLDITQVLALLNNSAELENQSFVASYNFFRERLISFFEELIVLSFMREIETDRLLLLNTDNNLIRDYFINRKKITQYDGGIQQEWLQVIRNNPLGLNFTERQIIGFGLRSNIYENSPLNEKSFLIATKLLNLHFSDIIDVFKLDKEVRRSIIYSFKHFPEIFFYFMNHPK